MSTSVLLAPPSVHDTTRAHRGHPDFEPRQTSVEPPRTAEAAGSQALFEPASSEAAGDPERTEHAPRNLTTKGPEIPEALNMSGIPGRA
jgi:hypothetical protein